MWLYYKNDTNVAVLSAGVCALGCYILTCSTEQFRLLALGQHVSKVLSKKGLFMLMTLALGGVSTYAMNFLNLASLSMTMPEIDSMPARPLSIEFKVVPLAVSVFFACLFAFFGLYVAAKDPMFAKSKKEIVESFISGAKGMTLKEVQAISSFKMFYVISTQKLFHLVMGGLLTGMGATVTACLCMWSLAIPDVDFVWNGGVIAGTCVFACFFSIVAFWILFRLLSLYPRKEILRIASSLFMAFGFILTHYFAMDGVPVRSLIPIAADDSVALTGRHHLGQSKGFYIILVAVVIFCFGLLVLTIVDLRSWLYESSSVVAKHEMMLLRLKGMHTDNFAIIAKHMREVELERSHHSSNASGSPRKASSLLNRSIHSATDTVSSLGKHLPLGRGKVTPRTPGVDGNTSPHASSQVVPLPASLEGRDDTPITVSAAAAASASVEISEMVSAGAAAASASALSSGLSIRLPDRTSSDDRDIESGLATN